MKPGFCEKIRRFDEASRRNKRILYYCALTLTFAVCATLVFGWYWIYGKSLVSTMDAIDINYNLFIYYGRYLRSIIKGFLATGQLNIPLWNFNMGYGADILTTTNYMLGDPTMLIAVFARATSTSSEFWYAVMILFRIFLAGVTFSAYCHQMGKGRFPTLCGATVYMFCCYVMRWGARQPMHILIFIYLPLVLLGIEKIFCKQRPYTFIIAVALCGISNFVYFYVISALMVVYAIIRSFEVFKGDWFHSCCVNLGKFALYYAIGLMVSCVIFLPCVAGIFDTGRVEITRNVALFYPIRYYVTAVRGIFAPYSGEAILTIGVAGVAATALIFLFCSQKKRSQLKTFFIVATIFLIFPACGYVLNAFAYATNRWIPAYSLLLSYITVTMLPEMMKATKKQLCGVTTVSVIIGVIACLTGRVGTMELFISSYVIFLLGNLLLLLWRLYGDDVIKKNMWGKYLPRLICMMIVACSIAVQAKYLFVNYNYLNQSYNSGQAFQMIMENNAGSMMRAVNDRGDFHRYEENKYGQTVVMNDAVPNEVNSTALYYSLADGDVFEWMTEVDNNHDRDFIYVGLDGRAMTGALTSVKYFVVKRGLEQYLPYGYVFKTDSDKRNLAVYENENFLPFGYTYDSIIPREDYMKLIPIERQQALLQGAVLDNNTTALPECEMVFTQQEIPYTMSCSGAVTYTDGVFDVRDKSASVTLEFNGLPACETYLNFENLWFIPDRPSWFLSKDALKTATVSSVLKQAGAALAWGMPIQSAIYVKSDNVSKAVNIIMPNYDYYINKHEFLTNMCYSDEARSSMTLTFNQSGKYTFDALRVLCQPMTALPSQVEKLSEDIMENVAFETNAVSGSISLDKPKVLSVSLPYSEGWKCFVDGVETPLLRVNTIFSGVILEPGEHEISLKYCTPYLKVGIAVSLLGLLCFGGLVLYHEKKLFRKS